MESPTKFILVCDESHYGLFHNKVIKLKGLSDFRAKIPNKKFYSLDF
jgi:hypothetical protein